MSDDTLTTSDLATLADNRGSTRYEQLVRLVTIATDPETSKVLQFVCNRVLARVMHPQLFSVEVVHSSKIER